MSAPSSERDEEHLISTPEMEVADDLQTSRAVG
jgi:hypothetical protein